MSQAVRNHKVWLIPVCLAVAAVGLLYGWQQLHAQGMGPQGAGAPVPADPYSTPGQYGAPGMPGAAPMGAPGAVGMTGAGMAVAPVTVPSEPTIELKSMLPAGVKVIKVKNWDGSVTEFLRFKHKTLDRKVITVHLPATYKKEKMTRAGWDTAFQVYAMDCEARLDAREKNWGINPWQTGDGERLVAQFMSRVGAGVPSTFSAGDYAQTNPAAAAADYARSSLPSMGMQLPPMPPALPGML